MTKARDPAAATKKRGTLGRLLRYLAIKKAKLIATIVLFGIGTFCFIMGPILVGQAVNLISTGGTLQELKDMVILMVALAITAFGTLYIAYRWLADMAQQALFKMRKELFDHAQELSLNVFDRQPIGELMSGVTNDIDAVAALFQGPLGSILLGIFLLIIIAVAMIVLNPTMAFVALLVVPAIVALIWGMGRLANPLFKLMQQGLANLSGFEEETLAGSKTVIAYRYQEKRVDDMDGISRDTRNVGVKSQSLGLLIGPLIALSAYVGVAIVSLVGSNMLLKDKLDIGVLVTFINLSVMLILPLITIFFNYNYVLKALAGAVRIFKFLDEKPVIFDKPGAEELAEIKGEVVFQDVDFSYVKGRKILKKNTFTAKPGDAIGLCGPTGAGKSTIINILTRYYDIDSGSITIDGHSIYDVTQKSLRSQIGVVLQEAFLFSDTVMNNLKYAREGATDEECIAAAKKANCDEFISHLPQGYNTVLTDRGANLSQGQRQLLTIARAMVANPKMLILDEATSNVDTRTEKLIQQAIKELQKGKTSFVIAHRLSTIKDSNMILVINEGEIVERGTHEELMGKRGFYYDLFMSQYKGKVSSVLPTAGPAPAKGATP
ncbi:MAG TPA: ABC transporter ATP-binding protein [Methanomassiliicoccales archaeon]|nr:ABC transporter ATP-binding protein [Methanomassiliicoccales archaeon]